MTFIIVTGLFYLLIAFINQTTTNLPKITDKPLSVHLAMSTIQTHNLSDDRY